MSKKVTFTPKPAATTAKADGWVTGDQQADSGEKTKRFTFDVPETLHRRVKARCAEKGVDMAEEMRRLLMEHFPPPDTA
jgi:hypothetical protein